MMKDLKEILIFIIDFIWGFLKLMKYKIELKFYLFKFYLFKKPKFKDGAVVDSISAGSISEERLIIKGKRSSYFSHYTYGRYYTQYTWEYLCERNGFFAVGSPTRWLKERFLIKTLTERREDFLTELIK